MTQWAHKYTNTQDYSKFIGVYKHTAPSHTYICKVVWQMQLHTNCRVSHLINVSSTGFGWRFALRCGSVCGLSPDGACWPVGLYRSRSTVKVLTDNEKAFSQLLTMSDEVLDKHTIFCQHWKSFGYLKWQIHVCVSLFFLVVWSRIGNRWHISVYHSELRYIFWFTLPGHQKW